MAPKATLRLLIVEDREVMQKVIRRLLVQLGYADIDVASNGRRALEKLAANSYDLILSDWNMDEMSGFELLKSVRAGSATASVPFILVTAQAKPENMLAAKAAGASGYLLKPFKLEALKAAIDEVLTSASPARPVAV